MNKEKKKSKMSTQLCKAALSMSMASMNEQSDDCTFIFYEPKQPKLLEHTDIKLLKKRLKDSM